MTKIVCFSYDTVKKTDILLIRSLGVDANSLPQGLLYLQSFLRKHGYKAKIWDRYVNRNIFQLRKALKNVPVVGISAMSIQSADAIYLSKTIRHWYPEIKIVLGGVHFTALPDTAIGIADNVVIGEGETAIKDYLDSCYNLDFKITRLPIEHLDEIPKFTMKDLKPLIRTKDHFHIIRARGCPYRCNFCLSKEQRPGGLRYHSIVYVVDYLREVVETFDIKSFFIVDDIFVLSPRRVYEFCDAVETQIKKKLTFSCFTHSGHGSLELYKRMEEVGFEKISMGVEHGNDRLLEFCGKKTTKKVIEETCAKMFQANIKINLTYILGNATETNETISETVDFAIHLHEKFNTSSWFSFMQPLPGSALFNNATQYGAYLNNDLQFYSNTNPVYLPFGVSREHLISERERGMKLANKQSNTLKSLKLLPYVKNKIRQLYGQINTLSIDNELKRVRSIVGPVTYK